MSKRGAGTSKGRRQTGVVRRRRVLNAFVIDKTYHVQGAASAAAAEELEEEESGEHRVKSEDDEDIDSDEAFDESDEERFSTFKFSGSSAKVQERKVRFNEKVDSLVSSDQDGQDLQGEDEYDDEGVYMDLSEMLPESQSRRKAPKIKVVSVMVGQKSNHSDSSEDEESGSDKSDESVLENSDSEEDDGKLESLSAFVDSFRYQKEGPKPEINTEAMETVSQASTSISMNDILSSLTDPSLQTLRKSLQARQSGKSKTAAKILSAPLAKPLQKRLERQAAYEETKTEITKWQPLIKANREADYLHFPMNEPPKQIKQTAASLAGTFEPTTSLEKTIDSLLRESGLRTDKEITSFEDLALKKVSIDEVQQRQAQLRAMRELMFRQDQKAKRIAKIKSKTYRRIHKKEREREMARKTAAGEEDGEEDSVERRLKAETARARERMTLRHKNTGDWARKMLNRGQHDLETRQAISEQIRRGDDLQRKVLGIEESDDGEDVESGSEQDLDELIRDPSKWGEEQSQRDQNGEIRKGVMGMKFMRDAEERQKQVNAEQTAEIKASRHACSDENEDPEDRDSIHANGNTGRKTFVPGDQVVPIKTVHHEAGDLGSNDTGNEVIMKIVKNPFHLNDATRSAAIPKPNTSRMASADDALPVQAAVQSAIPPFPFSESTLVSTPADGAAPAENPWLATQYKKPPKKSNSDNRISKIQSKRKQSEQENEEDPRINIDVSIADISAKLNANNEQSQEDGKVEEAPQIYGRGRIGFQQRELINRAFAGDGFEQDFAAEKDDALAEDAPKEEDLTLPGWGSWTGHGVKRRAIQKKLIRKVPGIDPSKRKDARLKDVIIQEKTVKKNSKYLAGSVPYPFETREQYERSLNMSVGPEWTTREMYQKMTKPRVAIRAGAVVNPLQAPFK